MIWCVPLIGHFLTFKGGANYPKIWNKYSIDAPLSLSGRERGMATAIIIRIIIYGINILHGRRAQKQARGGAKMAI